MKKRKTFLEKSKYRNGLDHFFDFQDYDNYIIIETIYGKKRIMDMNNMLIIEKSKKW